MDELTFFTSHLAQIMGFAPISYMDADSYIINYPARLSISAKNGDCGIVGVDIPKTQESPFAEVLDRALRVLHLSAPAVVTDQLLANLRAKALDAVDER